MPKSQKGHACRQAGFAGIYILVGILLLSVLGGVYYFGVGKNIVPFKNSPKACTQEAKQCPDGSYVGREGPNCEFKSCSVSKASPSPDETANWKTYTHPEGLYSLKYPANFIYKEIPNTHGKCKKQLILVDEKNREIIEEDKNPMLIDDIAGIIVIDVCSVSKESFNKTLNVEGPDSEQIILDGRQGYAASGISDWSGVGYPLDYEFHVDRKAFYDNGLEYFIDLRYKPPYTANIEKDFDQRFKILNEILSTFKFTKQ